MDIHKPTPTELELAEALLGLAKDRIRASIEENGKEATGYKLGLNKIGIDSVLEVTDWEYRERWDIAQMIRILDCLNEDISPELDSAMVTVIESNKSRKVMEFFSEIADYPL